MAPTDLTSVVLPAWAIPREPRSKAVEGQSICIEEQWWQRAVADRGLPGAVPVGPELTRGQVWAADGDVFSLLWRTLAWGSGKHLRDNKRRLDSIASGLADAERTLTRAAEAAQHDPCSAYTVLRPGDRNAIAWLGPSFFTKFLYFAGRGAPEHPCLILDRVVATALRDHCGWASLNPIGNWPAATYQRYCALLARWADEHACAPDELERALFKGPPKAAS